MTRPESLIDRALLNERRRRALSRGTDATYLADRAAADIVERLQFVRRAFRVGAVLGWDGGRLAQAMRAASICETLLEIVPMPTDCAGGQSLAVIAEEEALPLAEGCCDLIVSALSLQFVNDLPGTLVQARRALKPDGLFLAILLGGETLTELRQAWFEAETEARGGVSPRVLPFADVRTLGNLLTRAGFALPVADSDSVTVTYASPLVLMHDLSQMAASNVMSARSRCPVSRGLLSAAASAYADRHGAADGRVPATFEFITLTGWAPHESQQQPLKPGSAEMPLAEALRRRT